MHRGAQSSPHGTHPGGQSLGSAIVLLHIDIRDLRQAIAQNGLNLRIDRRVRSVDLDGLRLHHECEPADGCQVDRVARRGLPLPLRVLPCSAWPSNAPLSTVASQVTSTVSTAGRIAGPWCCRLLNEPDVFAPFFTDAEYALRANRLKTGERDAGQRVLRHRRQLRRSRERT